MDISLAVLESIRRDNVDCRPSAVQPVEGLSAYRSIDLLGPAGGYASDQLAQDTPDTSRSNTTRLMHTLHGKIPANQYPLILGVIVPRARK